MTNGKALYTVLLAVAVSVVVTGDAGADWWCGPSGSALSRWIPDQPTINALRNARVDFRGPCMRHDVCYTIRNNDKDFCDDTFLNEMRTKCDQEFGQNQREHENCLRVANAYYRAVRFSLGERAYREAQTRR